MSEANCAASNCSGSECEYLRRQRDELWSEIAKAKHGDSCYAVLAEERDKYRDALEYIAYAGLSARHIEDYAKKILNSTDH
jgi:hypothetical protein